MSVGYHLLAYGGRDDRPSQAAICDGGGRGISAPRLRLEIPKRITKLC